MVLSSHFSSHSQWVCVRQAQVNNYGLILEFHCTLFVGPSDGQAEEGILRTIRLRGRSLRRVPAGLGRCSLSVRSLVDPRS